MRSAVYSDHTEPPATVKLSQSHGEWEPPFRVGDPIAEIKNSACLLVIMHIFLVKGLSALTMRSTLYTKYGYDIEVGPVSVTMALNFRANGSKLTKYTIRIGEGSYIIYQLQINRKD